VTQVLAQCQSWNLSPALTAATGWLSGVGEVTWPSLGCRGLAALTFSWGSWFGPSLTLGHWTGCPYAGPFSLSFLSAKS
jgi:hypothetical protein